MIHVIEVLTLPVGLFGVLLFVVRREIPSEGNLQEIFMASPGLLHAAGLTFEMEALSNASHCGRIRT